ncbi:hypothetical protein SUDANB174_06979 [Streptomyces sp. enrichment culture]
MTAGPAYPIASVENTLRILLLPQEREALTLADVAAELGIARSSAHRLMAMLAYYDFGRQDSAAPSARAPALIDAGLSAVRALDVRALARPVLTELAAATEMTAHLALPRGRDVLHVDGVESRRTIRAALRTGTRCLPMSPEWTRRRSRRSPTTRCVSFTGTRPQPPSPSGPSRRRRAW